MVNKCSAFGCKSGYKCKGQSGPKVTFHAFPVNDQDLCAKWLKANPRKGFIPSKHSKLCSLHFHPSDFVSERTDSNSARKNRKLAVSEQPLRRRLKPDAIPSIFANAPRYLTTPKSSRRKTKCATASSRHEQEAARLDVLEQSFTASDNIAGLTLLDVQTKLQTETGVPEGYLTAVVADKLLVYLLDVDNDTPRLSACITVASDLCLTVSLNQSLISPNHYEDLVSGCLEKLSQLINLMARVKSWTVDNCSWPLSLVVDMALKILKVGLRNQSDDDCSESRRLRFAIEQLKLLATSKFGRHYSPQMTVMAYMVHASSAAAYNALLESDVLCLPSVSTLKKVTKRLDNKTGLDNTSYLKLRTSKLSQQQQVVVLMIDEIYVAKRAEYSGGDVQGVTTDGSVATTLLCFMIKSLTCKYKDIVAIYPMCKLTAEKEYECFKAVMKLLSDIEVRVVAVSVDNAAVNRKFYVEHLSGGNLKTNIVDDITGQPLYLLFDPVHNLKNLYNNFQARKVFQCPPMDRNLPSGCEARFQDLVELHELEATMALKKAHRLRPAVLEPKNIEKTSTKLAVAVFCESTRDALNFYSKNEGKSAWQGTADFLSLILKLWNVLNVKTRTKGKHKRDFTMDPVRSSGDWKLEFLREFADFLLSWENSRRPGLTRETFLAVRHTCLSLADCASYLLDTLGFGYVLLGHLQSDALEARFGWFRQLSGANYFISMKQVLDSDRKLRTVSLLKFSGLSLTDIDDAIHSDATTNDPDNEIADFLAESLTGDHWPSSNDATVIYYVSGAIARSVVRCNKCDHCKEALQTDTSLEPLQMDQDAKYRASTFLDDINRGGLSRPSGYTFMTAVQCWRVFNIIRASADLLSKLLSATSHRALFCKVMDRAMDVDMQDVLVPDNYCFRGHDLKTMIVRRFFNCVAKNLVRELSNQQAQQPSKKRKLDKLGSCTSQQH